MTPIPTHELIERLRKAHHRCYGIAGIGDFNLDDVADRLEQLERERTYMRTLAEQIRAGVRQVCESTDGKNSEQIE